MSNLKSEPLQLTTDREKDLLVEIGRLHLSLTKANKEIERLKGLVPPDDTSFLGKAWSLIAEKLRLERDALSEILAGLREKGIIDQHNRPLPLEGHHKDCGHGKDGWSLCTCDKLRNRDARQFSELMNDIDASTLTTSHVAEPKCSKCGDTGRITIFGEGIATPTWCTACPRGRPSPLAESLTKAFQTAAADAVRTTLDRGGTAVGEVQGQWRVVSKTCEHGNAECKKCGVGQPTRDPRQDLKVGQHVRFEIEGIIKERQSAGIFQDEDGSDFEPIQYAVKDSINGMNYYVGYHQITKVIGKEK